MQLGDARTGKMADNMIGFCRALRRAGVPVDSARMALAIDAAMLVGVSRKDDFAAALEAVLISRQQDREVFAQLFDSFFKNPELAHKLLSQMLPKAQEAAKAPKHKARVQEALTAVRAAQQAPKKEEELQLDAAMSASDGVRLRHADFQNLSASEFRLVERLVRDMALPLPQVPGRRTHSGERGKRMDWQRAMRDATRMGGELLHIPHRTRRPQPLPLLILVDISGSMERYARLMLAFLHQATRRVPRAVFAFGTELTDLRAAFRLRDSDAMLEAANQSIQDFAGGTRLGAALTTLRTAHRRCLVGRRTVVLLISDGLDTGEPQVLADELAWLKRHSRSLLWLNPLLRFDGYAPLAAGAKVLHQHADGMLAIHNLSELEQLAQAIAQLLHARGVRTTSPNTRRASAPSPQSRRVPTTLSHS
jgi:uncharacterized protein with von Willebrand factor type A (vWA) domain